MEMEEAALKSILQTLFTTSPDVDFALVAVPREFLSHVGGLCSYFRPLQRNGVKAKEALYTEIEECDIWVAMRSSVSVFVQDLCIRRARMEDHDDLLPVLLAQNESLQLNFGDFYLANLIEAQDEHSVTLVATVDKLAIGIMHLRDDVDLKTLQECFDLSVYGNLLQAPPSIALDEDAVDVNDVTVQAKKRMAPKIIIAGPPAAGKGTQCAHLVSTYDIIHLSTGDMLRAAAVAGTDIGKEAKRFMDAGDLVPDTLIIDIILQRLQEHDCVTQGWLLDGFPRTGIQADVMKEAGILPDTVILLDVDDDIVISRISGRRVDPETGATYHMEWNPPPEDVLDRVIIRDDDTPETIKVRLGNYHKNVEAVLDAFSDEVAGFPLVVRLDGAAEKTSISTRIEEAVNERMNAVHRGPEAFFSVVQDEMIQDKKNKSEFNNTSQTVTPNAFVIDLFCLDERYSSRAADFLPYGMSKKRNFELFFID